MLTRDSHVLPKNECSGIHAEVVHEFQPKASTQVRHAADEAADEDGITSVETQFASITS